MNIDEVSKIKKYSIIGGALYIIIYYCLIIFPSPEIKSLFSDILSPLGEVICLLIMGWSIKNLGDKISKKIWKYCFLGTLFYVLSDSMWFYYEFIIKSEVPYPSIADFLYIICIVLYFIAAIIYFKNNGLFIIARNIFDMVIVMVIATTLEWHYVINSIVTDVSLDFMGKFISILYPVTDLVLLFITVVRGLNYMNIDKNRFHSNLLIFAPLVWIIGDQFYMIELNQGSYNSGDLLDPLWLLGILILSIISILDVEFSLSKGSFNEELNNNDNMDNKYYTNKYVSILTPYICTLLLLSIFSKYVEWNDIALGTFSIVTLIICRQVFTILENKILLTTVYESNRELEHNKNELEIANKRLNEVNKLIEHEANTDFLTQLYNRRHVRDKLLRLIQKADNENISLSVMMIDIDHFKSVNDTYGHKIGDLVLKELAEIMINSVRSTDIVGRYGGEEFIIIEYDTRDISIDNLINIAERLRLKVANHKILLGDNSFSITISIGISKWIKGEDNLESLIIRADKALYESKDNGRNKVTFI